MAGKCTCVEAEAARILVEAGAVLRGRFRLSSGGETDLYIDARRLLASPRYYTAVLGLLSARARGLLAGVDAVVGVATGGIPWASMLALTHGLPAGYVRGRPKEYGAGRAVEGWGGPGRALLVDDVATTGSSLARAVEALRGGGVEVEAALVIVDRGEGAAERLAELDVALYSLTTASAIRRLLSGEPG